VGEIFIDQLKDTRQLHDLTPGIRATSIDALLMFFCYDGDNPVSWVRKKLDNYDRPDNAPFFYDSRTHSRYQGRRHIKRIITSEIQRKNRVELLKGENITINHR
jgi:hypothetical protein